MPNKRGPAPGITLDEAAGLTRTGDVWLFRGRKPADRAIQVATNSPVNHVGMSVVLEDLPPLLWHAELGRSLPDLWSGTRHRGVQLHDLRAAVTVCDDLRLAAGYRLGGEIAVVLPPAAQPPPGAQSPAGSRRAGRPTARRTAR